MPAVSAPAARGVPLESVGDRSSSGRDVGRKKSSPSIWWNSTRHFDLDGHGARRRRPAGCVLAGRHETGSESTGDDHSPATTRRACIRAPRGPAALVQELADRGGAADAHEQPRPGGRRAAGGTRRLRRHRPRRPQLGVLRQDRRGAAAARETTRRCSCSPASRSACSRRTPTPRGCCIANSNLVPRWATWEHFHELDRKGLMMYGQMTAGSWIYIGSQGIVQGTYETFAAVAKKHFGGNAAGQVDSDRRARRHGRRTAARRDDGRLLAARRRVRREPHRLPPAHPLPRPQGRRAWTRRSPSCAKAKPACRSGCSATPPTCARNLSHRGITPDVVTDQTSAHDPLNGYLPQGWTLAEWRERRRRPTPHGGDHGGEGVDGGPRPGDAANSRSAARRRSTTATTSARWRRTRAWPNAFDIPGFVPGVHPPAVLRGNRPVPLGRALRRPGRHSPHRREGEGTGAGRPAPAPLARHGPRADRVPGACRPASAGSA